MLLILIKIMFNLSQERKQELIHTANQISRRGFGILAADESEGTIGAKFAPLGIENTEENQRRYRTLLATTEGLEQYISGVIFFKGTAEQKIDDGTLITEVYKKKGILLGIKLDKGLKPILGTNGEFSTQGLDDLEKVAAEYYDKGFRFAKWRTVLKVGPGLPSELSVNLVAQGLARYASICQMNGIVPIVEPEVLIDGAHSFDECEEATNRANAALFKALNDHHVLLEGCLLKPNMVTPGKHSPEFKTITPTQVAARTIRTMRRTVPAAIPGIFVTPTLTLVPFRRSIRGGGIKKLERDEQVLQPPLGYVLLLRPCSPAFLHHCLEGH